MPTLGQQQYNIGPIDLLLSVSEALPAAGGNVTTGVLDLQSIAPNGDAWRLGRIAVKVPAIAGNVADGVTIAVSAANADLTTGSAAIAPNLPVAGAYVTPAVAQTLTISPVAVTGSSAAIYYFAMPFDSYGNPYQFLKFVITAGAGSGTNSEVVTIGFANA